VKLLEVCPRVDLALQAAEGAILLSEPARVYVFLNGRRVFAQIHAP